MGKRKNDTKNGDKDEKQEPLERSKEERGRGHRHPDEGNDAYEGGEQGRGSIYRMPQYHGPREHQDPGEPPQKKPGKAS